MNVSKRSKYGLYSLLIVLLLLIVWWRIAPLFNTSNEQNAKEENELQAAWTAYKKNNVKDEPVEEAPRKWINNDNSNPAESNNIAYKPKAFDPNTASEEILVAVGFPIRTARTLIKYRNKGGHFWKKEDLKKLYTLTEQDYNKIAPYVSITNDRSTNYTEFKNNDSKTITYSEQHPLELNKATAEQLMSLRGIGPGYSNRIINFRNALGGFLKIEQLKEVYGFPDSTYQQLKDKFTVDAQVVQKLNVNLATEEELAAHPYIGKKLAPNITKLRNDLKSFTEIEQLRQVPLINEEKYRKIAAYLSTH